MKSIKGVAGSFWWILKNTLVLFEENFVKNGPKLSKKERFFPSYCKILEKKIDFLLEKFKYFFKKCQYFLGHIIGGWGHLNWILSLTKSTLKVIWSEGWGSFGRISKSSYYYYGTFRFGLRGGWVGHFADFRKVMIGSFSKSTDPLPYMYLIAGGFRCARNVKSLSVSFYRRKWRGRVWRGNEGKMFSL